MTDIEVTDASGQVVGWGKDHLAFAYSYGDGKDKSCRLMSDAVSNLVNNIPIVYYCAANINSLGTLINIVGSVEVQVPNDDLKQFGPEYEKRSVLRVCTLLLRLSLQILVHLINSNCHSSDLSGRSVLVVNTLGCCLVDDACCA